MAEQFRAERQDGQDHRTFAREGKGVVYESRGAAKYPHAEAIVRRPDGETLEIGLPYSHHGLAKMVTTFDFESVLEIGSRTGEAARIFEFLGKEVFTVEFDPRQQASYTGDFLDVAIDRQFDAVWASHVLEHQRNPGLFLDKCFDVLREGGVFCVTIPCALAPLLMEHPVIMTPAHMIYNLICAGFDCRDAMVKTYDWQFSVIVQKKTNTVPRQSFGAYPPGGLSFGGVERLGDFFPEAIGVPLMRDWATWGEIESLNWE